MPAKVVRVVLVRFGECHDKRTNGQHARYSRNKLRTFPMCRACLRRWYEEIAPVEFSLNAAYYLYDDSSGLYNNTKCIVSSALTIWT